MCCAADGAATADAATAAHAGADTDTDTVCDTRTDTGGTIIDTRTDTARARAHADPVRYGNTGEYADRCAHTYAARIAGTIPHTPGADPGTVAYAYAAAYYGAYVYARNAIDAVLADTTNDTP